MPFNLEEALKERGADYRKALVPMTSKVVVDGNLIMLEVSENDVRVVAHKSCALTAQTFMIAIFDEVYLSI